MAIQTQCQTPEAQYQISIKGNKVSCAVTLPFNLDVNEEEAELLEANIHNLMELVLTKYFKK